MADQGCAQAAAEARRERGCSSVGGAHRRSNISALRGATLALAFLSGVGALKSPAAGHHRVCSLKAVDPALFFVAGGISCMASHAVAVPFDVIKTRKQTSEGSVNLQKLIEEEGLGILAQGLGPTLVGYAVQGSLKYGLYEIFKSQLLAQLDLPPGAASPLLTLMLAGGCAEVIASSFLSPFEAARIRLVSNPAFADGLVPCLQRISTEEGSSALFFGLPAILAKQVPYTILQLSTFDSFSASISRSGLLADRFYITLTAALAAAVLSSLASQPGDTLLSIVNKKARSSSSSSSSSSSASDASSVNALSIISAAVAELGPKGLFRGTQARLVHVGVIVVSQLLIYDSIKQSLGIPIGGH